jgi:hypothetical protein
VFDGERFTLADTGAYGRSGTIVNLGFWLPLITPRGPDGRFDERPLPKMGEHVYFEPAHFYVSLDLPRDHVVASTGVELERVESGDRARVVMVASAVRDFAMNLSPDFAITEGEVDGLRVRIFHDPERPAIGRDLLSYALDSASWMDRELGRLSAAELDVVDAPARLVLGQEFPGLVTIDTHHDTGVYVRSDDHAWTLAHEVAHQWWFSEVGNDAAASPWLDEALASHSAALFWEEAHGRESLDRWLQSEVFDAYELLTAAGVPDRPANLPGDAYNIVQYGAVIYGKAVMFYEALREAVGQDAHRAALRRLYREHRLDFLEDEDVLRVWSRASADSGSVQVLFDRWIAGAHGSSDLVRPEASSE